MNASAWSRDSKYLYFENKGGEQPGYRGIKVGETHSEFLVDLKNLHVTGGAVLPPRTSRSSSATSAPMKSARSMWTCRSRTNIERRFSDAPTISDNQAVIFVAFAFAHVALCAAAIFPAQLIEFALTT